MNSRGVLYSGSSIAIQAMRTVRYPLDNRTWAFADWSAEAMAITNARLLGALIKSFPAGSSAAGLIKYDYSHLYYTRKSCR